MDFVFDITKASLLDKEETPKQHECCVFIPRKYWTLLGDQISYLEHEPTMVVRPDQVYTIRVDIMGMSKLKRSLMQSIGEPIAKYSTTIERAMIETATVLCKKFQATMAFTQSDEITLVVAPSDNPNYQHLWGGKRDKIISDAAGLASLTMTMEIQKAATGASAIIPIQFDARLAIWPSIRKACDLIMWRAHDVGINGVSDAVHQLDHIDLLKTGMSRKVAAGLHTDARLEVLAKLDLLPLPEHQAYGTLLYRHKVPYIATNPTNGQQVEIVRWKYAQLPRSNIVNRFHDETIWKTIVKDCSTSAE